jgi:hypothetical protein
LSLVPRSDGKIGPPVELIVDDQEPGHSNMLPRRTRWRVTYDRFDAKHDRLIYRVIEVL